MHVCYLVLSSKAKQKHHSHIFLYLCAVVQQMRTGIVDLILKPYL